MLGVTLTLTLILIGLTRWHTRFKARLGVTVENHFISIWDVKASAPRFKKKKQIS